jgi:cell wall-associated NlpC family hydrolase
MIIQVRRRDAASTAGGTLALPKPSLGSAMRLSPKRTVALLLLCGVPCLSSAQQPRKSASSHPISRASDDPVGSNRDSVADRTLTPDDGLAVIAAALDSHTHVGAEPDCSHLVHAIYSRAGFSYSYAPSSDLYAGTREFQRVTRPQPGDLVVWRGHAGIVVNPAQHVFFSALRSGLGTDVYDAPYWKSRGRVRFYRYIKGSFFSTHK